MAEMTARERASARAVWSAARPVLSPVIHRTDATSCGISIKWKRNCASMTITTPKGADTHCE